jgi:hypothetical protein
MEWLPTRSTPMCVLADGPCTRFGLEPDSGVIPRLVAMDSPATTGEPGAVWVEGAVSGETLLQSALAAIAARGLQYAKSLACERSWHTYAGLVVDCLAGLLAGGELTCTEVDGWAG